MGRSSYSSRLLTNQCKQISVNFLKRELYFFRFGRSGEIQWKNARAKISVSLKPDGGLMRIAYVRSDRFSGAIADLDYEIQLTSSACHFGGIRWWFSCPLVKDGKACNRRVGVIYLGGGNIFGCRHCYDLAYESSRDSHKFDRFLKTNPFKQIINSLRDQNKRENLE